MNVRFNSFLKRSRRNTLAFLFTFGASVLVWNIHAPIRSAVSQQAQYQLYRAASVGNAKLVRLLLLAGANAQGSNTTFSPLHVASRNGHAHVVRILLDEGADVDYVGSWGQTPLMETVWGGHLDTAKLLLARGANVSRDDEHDGTALWQARLANQIEMVRLLMRHGGRNCKDAESVLSAAVEDDDTELVKALLAGGVDPVDVTATHQVLPLTKVAARNGNKEMIKLLKQAGAE